MIVVSRNIKYMRLCAGVPMSVAPNDSEVVDIKTQANDLSLFSFVYL